jgi:AcrR family transcriptional regulator
MARSALTQPQIDAFRDGICAAATKLFAEQGYDAVTLRSIATEVGCSPMTPYRYFDGKAEIFAMVRADAYRRFADAQEVVVAATPEPGDRLAALARVYVAFAVAQPDAYRIMFELAQNDDTQYPELEVQSHRAWAPLRDAVGAAVGAGLIAGDPEDVAHLYWAQVHGLVALHLAGKLTLGRSLEQLLAVMLGADTERRTTPC